MSIGPNSVARSIDGPAIIDYRSSSSFGLGRRIQPPCRPRSQPMPTSSAHTDLQALARQAMVAAGFQPDFPPAVNTQLAALAAHPPAVAVGPDVRDLRGLLWSSIDNDTSRDLDQIEVAEA